MNKKKIIALSAATVLSATAVIGGTLAYFTDTDTENNTFTVGNVVVDLVEKDKDGNDFVDDQKLYPTTADKTDVHVSKVVTVDNVGSESAYLWTEMLIPAALDNSTNDNDSLHLVHNDNVKVILLGEETKDDGVKYNKYLCYIENSQAVAPEGSAGAFLNAVYMDSKVEQGTTANEYKLVTGENYTGSWNVIVNACGIQAAGIDNIEEAIKAFYDLSE